MLEIFGMLIGTAGIALLVVAFIRYRNNKKEAKEVQRIWPLIVTGLALMMIGGGFMPDNTSDRTADEAEEVEEVDAEAGEEEEKEEEKPEPPATPVEYVEENTGEELVEVDEYDDTVIIDFEKTSPGFTINTTREEMLRKSFTIAEGLVGEFGWEGGVSINWELPLTDKYGNENMRNVMNIRLSPETLEKINFDNFEYRNLEEIADEFGDHPAIRP